MQGYYYCRCVQCHAKDYGKKRRTSKRIAHKGGRCAIRLALRHGEEWAMYMAKMAA